MKKVNAVVEAIKAQLGDGFKVEATEVYKNNEKRIGIFIRATEETVAPTIYLSDDMLKAGADEVAEQIVGVYKKNRVQSPSDLGFNPELFKDWNWIKNRLKFKLVSTKGNKNLIKGKIHFNELGLTGIVIVMLDHVGTGSGSVMVSKEYASYWGVTADEVIATAKSNVDNDIKIVSMSAMLGMPETSDAPLWILTNNYGYFGASVMFSTEARKKLKEMTGWDEYYILPSSIHEIIAVPKNDEIDSNELIKMVKSVNRSIVEPEDRLTDNIFICNADNDLELVVGEVAVTAI